MKVLVISDTHNFLPVGVSSVEYDALVHAGDIGSDEFFVNISSCRNFFAVEGNTDYLTCAQLPDTLCQKLGGITFFLVHNLTSPSPDRVRKPNLDKIAKCSPDIVIFGHTHMPLIMERDGMVFLNPGSLGKPGLTGLCTYAIIEIEEGAIKDINIFDAETGGAVKSFTRKNNG